MSEKKPVRRVIITIFAGFLTGLFLLLCIFIPISIRQAVDAGVSMIQQENLISSRGEAFDTYLYINANITALLDSKPNDNISVSYDGRRWYLPENGALSLQLIPGEYRFQGIYGNRIVSSDYTIEPGVENTVVLDAAKAPEAPELLMLDLPERENQIFELDIVGADSVTMDTAPDGLRIIRQDDGFALEAAVDLLPYGFYHVTLRSGNERGEAVTHVGLRLPRSGAVIPIYTVEELSAIRHNLSGCFVLMNDLDMTDVHDWKPVGTGEYPFTGVFDGGGHEITGFHAPGNIPDRRGFGIFEAVRNAEIRNIIIRSPAITPADILPSSHCAALVSGANQSLIENCAVVGGIVAPADGGAGGLLVFTDDCVLLGLFNSADVFCKAAKSEMKNTGGITGIMGGYGAYLANEGEVFGTHLTGGIAGYQIKALLNRCVNSGYVWGSTLVGEFPVGGIVQTSNESIVRDSYFIIGQAALGGSAFDQGVLGPLNPITWEVLRNPSGLTGIGEFEGSNPKWAFASLDALGPVPYGIFKRQAELPDIQTENDKVNLPPIDGLVYYYTLDGSDPRINCSEGVTSAELALPKDGTLTVFAARQGCRDSEIMIITAGGDK